jgi:hypothetical protein
MGYYVGLNERGETYQEWCERTGQLKPSDEFLAECAASEYPTDVAVIAATQEIDGERAIKALGTLIVKLGYSGVPAGNGYFAIYDHDPSTCLGGAPKMLKFGRLDEVREWLVNEVKALIEKEKEWLESL